jgi:hypothetical protein
MLKSLSLKGILAGGSLLVAGIWLNETLTDICLPLTHHVTLAVVTVAFLHCTTKFITLPAIAGYLSGRIAGHHHGLNGMLAIVPLVLIGVALGIVQDGEALDLASAAFMVWGGTGFLALGWLGGYLSAHPRQELAALVAFFTGRPVRQSVPGSALPSGRVSTALAED